MNKSSKEKKESVLVVISRIQQLLNQEILILDSFNEIPAARI